jgi:uncharacterized protein
MSQENVEIVRHHIEAYLRGDYEAALAVFDRDVEYDVSMRPEGRVYHGRAGIVEAHRTWGGTWEDWTVEVEEIIDAGDKVLLCDRQTGRGKGSGAPLDQRTFWVNTFREGKIVRVKWFATRKEAIEAAGLRE